MKSSGNDLSSHRLRVANSNLRRNCDPATLPFKSTSELKPFEGLIGQNRALESLDLGARIDKPGFNMFVLGEPGTARHGTVKALIEQYAAKMPAPSDWIYVANWDQPDRPRALSMPAGRATKLKSALDSALDELLALIPAVYESADYQNRRQAALETINTAQEQAFEALSSKARTQDIALLRTQSGFTFAPISGDNVIPPDAFNALPEDKRHTIIEHIEALQKELAALLERLPAWERERRQKISALDQEFARLVVSDVMREVEESIHDLPEILAHTSAVTEELIRHFGLFRSQTAAKHDEQNAAPENVNEDDPKFRRFRINVLVGDGCKTCAPVIVEDNPSIGNLIGRIEQQAHMGALFTDFSLIRAGSLHLANGGYLLIDARRLLLEPYAWEMLKRSLRARSISIESPTDRMSIMSTQSLKPDPVPLSTKVILFGDRRLYYALFEGEPDFPELFKIAVDFEDSVDWTDSTVIDYAHLIGSIARREGLRPLSAGAVARVIEELSREADDASKLSLRIGNLADHLREAEFWATESGNGMIDTVHIERASTAWKRRHDRIQLRGQELIERGVMLVDTAGSKIGQINGLSVMSIGGYAFGKPSRITASVRSGNGEIIDIEREVDLGGPLHAKGVLILSSYLASHYAQDFPPSLHASLVFEQSYGGIDGDSASSTELYALLSALAEIPVKQNIAVTGSVNQRGEIQAIGGVNEKIEGFFALCKSRGLDGSHGVLIPAANKQHLMLDREIVEACNAGKFHVFAAATINEGIELLTGVAAGTRGKEGQFPKNTVNRRVEDKLIAFARARQKFTGAKPKR